MNGTEYVFAPTAGDGDGDTLTFSITGRPAWATFSSANGELRGTPSAAEVGTYSNIVISVSDGAATARLASFEIVVVATATGSATVLWTPPTTNTNGTPLMNLAGFKVHWGTVQGQYANHATVANPGITSFVVDQLTPGTWFFVTTAYTTEGAESAFSAPATKVIL